MSFHVYKARSSDKKKKTRYSYLFDYFGNIIDINDFEKRFENVLTCGRFNCDCGEDYNRIKSKFPHFQDLRDSLNRFHDNINNQDSKGRFSIGMIPDNLNELGMEEYEEFARINPGKNDSKIRFKDDSLCVYSFYYDNYDSKVEAYSVFKDGFEDQIDIELAGVMKYDMGFVDRFRYFLQHIIFETYSIK